MFKLLKLPFKIIILCAAIYGVLQIPVSGKPLWKHIQKTSENYWEMGKEKMSSLRPHLSSLRRQGSKILDSCLRRNDIFKIGNDKRRKESNKPQEMIRASEEERLEKILSGRLKKEKK